jgi:hypothetical protein
MFFGGSSLFVSEHGGVQKFDNHLDQLSVDIAFQALQQLSYASFSPEGVGIDVKGRAVVVDIGSESWTEVCAAMLVFFAPLTRLRVLGGIC